MKAIFTLVLAASAALAGTYNFIAIGTISPATFGADPFGNQWQIGPFGQVATWGIPGISSFGAGTTWMGPNDLLEVHVTATALGGVQLAPLPVQPNRWRNITDGVDYQLFYVGNEIQYVLSGPSALISGDQMTGLASFVNPSAHNTIQFDVTYITADETPEPASFALLGAGLIGIALYRRRRLANH